MEEQRQSLETVINKWVKNQPAWYSAALHIALQGTYTDEQIDALASAACKEQGVDLGVENPVTLAAYQPADLGGAGDAQRSVLLESITAESGINAIEKGSKLNVATSGITVIYGNNGSGKSGFSRIMRNSCTSRSGSSEILANVFEGNDTPPATFSARKRRAHNMHVEERRIGLPDVSGNRLFSTPPARPRKLVMGTTRFCMRPALSLRS